ncbi:unnamed protein product [Rotaria sp. Silwood2]|nr:unnamed protein product [Rotaria sp. Silwood2]CAF3123536.1 unnamed protein product [Rotaria sp. Silwood2]CAF4229689.1 unnamed protein product [Rotaria sp. Silwood2]CAF4287339.1 unnamed protein product [Rotaria sp. Silwood2]
MEELRRQFQREKETILKQLDEEKLLNTKSTKSNQKFSNDISDVTVELERYRTIVQDVEKQQRSFDKQRDQNEREINEKETVHLNLLRELEERNLAYEDLEKHFRQLRAEFDDMFQEKHNIGKNIYELERIKRALEATVEEQKQQIIEFEDELQTAEDARLRCEVNIGALKQQMEKYQHENNEQIEEQERKSKQQILQQRKKLEIYLQDARQQIQTANKQKEEALCNTRRLQIQVRVVICAMKEIKVIRNEALVNAEK